MRVDRPILVTGSHRSGTGWVGDMLRATPSPQLHVIWEPFNLRARRGVRDVPIDRWFTYVDDANAERFERAFRETFAFRYGMAAEARTLRSPKDVGRAFRDAACARAARRSGALPLSKDPIAVFSAPWLASTFDMDVVVTVRHPAAMVASVIRLGWRHPFDHFLAQPAMMRDILAPHEATIARFAEQEQPLLDQAALLWRLIYERVLYYRETYPEWHIVRHEDLSRDPVARFRKLYASLDLTWTDEVEAVVDEYTRAGNPVAVDDPAHHRRDSRAAVDGWKTRLSPAEIERIRTWTEPVASAFYTDDEWA